MGVADANARESGLEAMRNTPGYDPQELQSWDESRPTPQQETSRSSLTPLAAAALPPGIVTPSRSPHSFSDAYADNPYNQFSRSLNPNLGGVDPNSIEDDGDDGLEYGHNNRGSMLSLGQHSDRAPGVTRPAAAGGIMGTFSGLIGRAASSGRDPQYDPVSNTHSAYDDPSSHDPGAEKSEWLQQEKTGNKKLRWIVGILMAVLIVGGIAGGVIGGLLSRKSSNSTSTGQSASQDTASNGDLTKDSAEIKALMNNSNLHKVFPGIDYTPMNTQYPACLTNPPSQNNVTRDLAVLSQLTNVVRLYGTDCNQTEMLMHSIKQLGLNGTVKVWLGVWQSNNATTNQRQLDQMYTILDTYGTAPFVGVIIGNEVLFRQDMTVTELAAVITGVRSNFTTKGYSLPVASSDLGDNWTSELASVVDYVMANIHPFFAGVTADVAAAWTWNFWETNDVAFKTDLSKNIISETGWPSSGGTDCGAATTCTTGSVAGVQEMNTFMDTFVCQGLANSTTYFWFEAFDEPWKIVYDTPSKDWEDQWGLMDVNRNLKPGVVIPNCGGKTVG
jgi:exo-beta-1,3-glucanase (GH17 family)